MVSPDSHAVLIGVSSYDDPESFPDLQAAANSLRAMRALLADPQLCGWRPEQITTIPNPRSRAEVEGLLSDAAERTTGVFLVYYVGHGILSSRLELCLTLASTRPMRPKITGLPWESVAEILDVRNCPAKTRIAILDCCYAGQAVSESLGSSAAVADTVAVEGVYTLTATIRNKTAHVVPADQQELACTSFTGELCDVVRSGIEGRGKWLTLGEIYPVLRDRLRAKGLPLPNQKGTDTADHFPFAGNRAASAIAATKHPAGDVLIPARPAVTEQDTAILRQAALGCFDSVVSYVYGTHDYSNDVTYYRISRLAEYAAIVDPERAERIARRLPTVNRKMQGLGLNQDRDRRTEALAEISLVMATWATAHKRAEATRATDLLARASRIAGELDSFFQSTPQRKIISDAASEAGRFGRFMQNLTENELWIGRIQLVFALTAADPNDAVGYFEQAMQSSRFVDRHGRSQAQSDVARAMVTIDPERAFGIARNISSKDVRSKALCDMGQTVAIFDHDQAVRMIAEAERAASKIRDKIEKAAALYVVAEAIAPLDAPWAERVANTVVHPGLGPACRYSIASVIARSDQKRAERIGRDLPSDADKASILAIVARYFADPDRTATLLAEAEKYLDSLVPDARKAAALTDIALTLSAFDPGRTDELLNNVEAMLRNIADTGSTHLLLRIVRNTVEIDPNRAARILRNTCTMALAPESHAVNSMGRGITLQIIAENCMKILAS